MILITFGTRPEFIKVKPLIDILEENNVKYKTLFTGQHIDLLKASDVDYKITISVTNMNRLDAIVGAVSGNQDLWSILNSPLTKDKITHVLVQGDTTSALAIALSAFHNKVKVIHLESGLRTYNNQNPYPEEVNRRLISQIANIHLCPTMENKFNLVNEKILGEKYVIGNTSIDNLVEYKDKCEYTNKILITLHRRENHKEMNLWFKEVNDLAKEYNEYDFILPLHPNPNVQKYRDLLTNIKVIEPLSHNELLDILVKTRLVISDSGGLQEECSYFNKKILVCRKVTERSEVVGKSSFLVKKPKDLNKIFKEHIDNYIVDYKCPYGDGNSANKILKIFNEIE